MEKEYILIEVAVPNSQYPMENFWYGFWIEFTGKEKDFKIIKPELIKKCYSYMIEEGNKRNCNGFYKVEQITKDETFNDALNNKVFKASVGIKWHEQPNPST